MRLSVYENVKKLLESYTDHYGCVGLYKQNNHSTKWREFDNENRNLFTGQAILFCELAGIEVPDKWFSGMLKNHLFGGIYQRSPKGCDSDHRISHDEYVGICVAMGFFDDHLHSEKILKHGYDHNWFYSDKDPQSKYNFKDMGSWRQPSDRVLIKISAHKDPNWIECLWLLGAVIAATSKPKHKSSSKILSFVKLKYIELKGFDNIFIRLARKVFDKSMRKMYGDSYVKELYKLYFRDPEHPFHKLCPSTLND